MNLKQKSIAFLRAKGLYVVLMGCLGVVGGTALLAGEKSAAPEPTPAQVSRSSDERLQAAQMPNPPTPAPKTPAPGAGTPLPTKAPRESAPQATRKPTREKVSAPVKGTLQWGYAADELLYSETLKQWMTHCGVDIACAKGTEVHAVWGGTVTAVYVSDTMGVTVEMKHADGLRTVYCNLAGEPPVREGQKVNATAVIGAVGDTALSECAVAPHLHFELYKDDAALNPMEYIVLIEK
ncbi:MAG: M23 family metallopeptidase [Christensenellaceae bacterium]|jgi:murein DD-endopeptidase MepM/ murein hydrolase activator NlpD|nr:M23 family metallopeptidase [Christensenellaceae bacterium]